MCTTGRSFLLTSAHSGFSLRLLRSPHRYFKKASDYSNPDSLPHVQVALRTRANVGARIEYVMIIGDIGVKDAQRAFSPEEAENKIMDMRWYYERMKKTLKRLTDQVDGKWEDTDEILKTFLKGKKRKRDKEGFKKLFRM